VSYFSLQLTIKTNVECNINFRSKMYSLIIAVIIYSYFYVSIYKQYEYIKSETEEHFIL
jgi:hypothetical protein